MEWLWVSLAVLACPLMAWLASRLAKANVRRPDDRDPGN